MTEVVSNIGTIINSERARVASQIEPTSGHLPIVDVYRQRQGLHIDDGVALKALAEDPDFPKMKMYLEDDDLKNRRDYEGNRQKFSAEMSRIEKILTEEGRQKAYQNLSAKLAVGATAVGIDQSSASADIFY